MTSGSATLIDDEERAKGQVTFKTYWAYCTKVFKGGHVVALIVIQICWQGLQIASDFWLANSTSTQKTFQPKRFITVYGELAIGSGIFVLMRSLLISLVGLQTAQKFFMEMVESVFDAPMSFFDKTPTGRILSRVRYLHFGSIFHELCTRLHNQPSISRVALVKRVHIISYHFLLVGNTCCYYCLKTFTGLICVNVTCQVVLQQPC